MESNPIEVSSGISGVIFNIQRFSIHDGTGIRTLVFVKGCPLRCRWCANPEGFSTDIQVMDQPNKCIQCGACFQACPEGAIQALDQFSINRDKCTDCGICAKYCPSNAKTLCGESKTAGEIMDLIQRDLPFYGSSGGGVTIGGGEMLSQPAFSWEILRRCREQGINTAIETSGFGRWEWLSKIAEQCDIIHYDLKAMDPARHRLLTGASNRLILQNLENLDRRLLFIHPAPKLILRLPLIEEYNLTEDFLEDAADYIKNNLRCYSLIELLPFHNFGEQKYQKLGLFYELEGRPSAKPESLNRYTEIFERNGLPVRVSKW